MADSDKVAEYDIPGQLVNTLKRAEHIVVLTGAGVSAESGIPTFRDALTGLWANYEAEQLATPQAFQSNPALVWSWYQWRRRMVESKEPNPGHDAIVQLGLLATRLTLITQNVDGLHQAAGSTNVIELHGNIRTSICFDNRHPANSVLELQIRADDERLRKDDGDFEGEQSDPPVCESCGSRMRPNVVWFGESLDPANLEAAADAAGSADVFISAGTSSLVYPAAGLADLAARNSASIVEINPHRTPLTERADVVLQGSGGTMFPAIVDAWTT